jgi:hypothetical protein
MNAGDRRSAHRVAILLLAAVAAEWGLACSQADDAPAGASPPVASSPADPLAPTSDGAVDAAAPAAPVWGPHGDRPINRWVLEPIRSDNDQWETSIVFEPVTGRFIRHQGHELATYAQTSGTWALSLAQGTSVRLTPPVPPPRVCLVDGTYAGSIRSVVGVNGSSSHGSMPIGGPASAFTRIGYKDSTGPRLYDPATDRWVDARPPGAQWGTAPGTAVTYEPGSDVVVGRTSVGPLELYAPRANQVMTRSLPDALVGRRAYGIAADPDRRKIVVFGGTGPDIWTYASDRAAAYAANVHDDTWIYDVVTDTWREAKPSTRPPKGVPFYDYLELPMIYHPPSGTFLLLQLPIDHYGSDNASPTTWPSPELWSFDLDAETWTKIATENPPLEIGRIAYDSNEDAVVLFGGGRDGAQARPALSRLVYSVRVEVPGRPNRYDPPIDGVVATIRASGASGSTVDVTWNARAGERNEIDRAAASPIPDAYVKIGESAAGAFTDTVADAKTVFAYRVRRAGAARASLPAFTNPLRPSGLEVAVRSADRVELTWAPNRDPDVAGYRVFRARGSIATGAATELTTSLVTSPAFVDEAASLGDGTFRAYWIVAENRAGQRSGPSPYALTAPPIVERLNAESIAGGLVHVSWAWPTGSPVTFTVYRNDHHENTLDYDNTQYNAWMAEWTPVTAPGFTGTSIDVARAGTTSPHDYFYVRARNVLDQEGYLSDIVSATDVRFAPHVAP